MNEIIISLAPSISGSNHFFTLKIVKGHLKKNHKKVILTIHILEKIKPFKIHVFYVKKFLAEIDI